jgi:hypothetical protein
MSNLKEYKLQARITEEIQRWWCDIGCNDCAEEVAKSILIIIKQAGYYPLQANSEGLLADAELCRLGCTEYPTEEDIKFDGACGSCGLGRKLKRTVQAQKALCDKEKEEALLSEMGKEGE